MGKAWMGHAGKDLIIKVPVGTLVWKINDQPPQTVEARSDRR